MDKITELELLIVVKSYPNPSQSLGEATCVVGVCRKRGFVRIYPVPFRKLEDEQQFKKYQIIKLRAQEPKTDRRPNTFRPLLETIKVASKPLSTDDSWRQRREWILPLASSSMCEIMRQQKATGASIGLFKPEKVIDVLQEPETNEWSARELAKLQQQDLFMTKENMLLEKLPYRWQYHYSCAAPSCPGHKQTVIDWELGQLYRRIKLKGITDPQKIHQTIRQKYLIEMCANKDTYFFTGNMAAHPGSFLILGVFWPPINPQLSLF